MDRVLARFIFLFFVGVITISPASFASGAQLYISSLQGKPGQSINIPLMLDEVDNLAGVKIVMKYDTGILTFIKGTRTKQTSSLMHIINDKKPGLLIVVMAGAKGVKGKKFPILNLTFAIKKDLKGSHSTSLEITEAQLMSDKLKDISCDIKVGPLVIKN